MNHEELHATIVREAWAWLGDRPQRKLAAAADLTETQVSTILNGKIASLKTYEKILAVVGKQLDISLADAK